ncbi:MAG: Fis family transcriptional regulator [Chthonomonadaceae bacterium]|nr:Fis family transcriptional regulator [Chthonomonadaceae bacterium]
MQTVLFSDSNPSKSGRQGEPQANQKRSILSGKRVVIVEDEGITQMQLHRLLTLMEMEVVGAATSGPRGVEAVLQAKPDLVLMDIRMPGEYDGLEAARRILEAHPVCIVMLTAFAGKEYREQARDIGTCGYIVKPIDQDTLIPQLEAALSSFRTQ